MRIQFELIKESYWPAGLYKFYLKENSRIQNAFTVQPNELKHFKYANTELIDRNTEYYYRLHTHASTNESEEEILSEIRLLLMFIFI